MMDSNALIMLGTTAQVRSWCKKDNIKLWLYKICKCRNWQETL